MNDKFNVLDFFIDQQSSSGLITCENENLNQMSTVNAASQISCKSSYNTDANTSTLNIDDNRLTEVVEETCVFSDPEVDHPFYGESYGNNLPSVQQQKICMPHSHVHLKLISTQQESLVTPSSISDEHCIDIE